MNHIRVSSLAFAFVLAIGLFGFNGVARAIEVGKITVKSTVIDSGFNPKALAERVHNLIRTRKGQPFDDRILAEDVRALMESGNFTNVQANKNVMEDGRLAIQFVVILKPVIREIRFVGAKEYKPKRLKSIIEDVLTEGKPLNERAVAAARQAIAKRYHESGYFDVTITTSEEPIPDSGDITLAFVIKEETHHKLHQTHFENNTIFTRSELRRIIQTRRAWWRYLLRFGNYFNPQMLILDKQELDKAYKEEGYLDFEVTDIRQAYSGKKDYWVDVTYVLREGEPYTVKSVTISGNTKFSTEELTKLLVLTPGDTYRTSSEDADIHMLKGKYGLLGYMDVNAWATLTKHPETHEVDVAYSIYEGGISHIRNIAIVGNDITRDKVIRRELAVFPGDLGNPEDLELSKARIMGLGYFKSVNVYPVNTEQPDLKDIRIQLEEKPTGTLGIGGAYSTEDKFLATLEYTETNFDFGRMVNGEWPFKGGGQRLRTFVATGSETTNVAVSLTEPWFLDRRLSLTTEFFVTRRDENEYEQRNIGCGISLAWPITMQIPFTDIVEKSWRMHVGVRIEHVRISDADTYNEAGFVRPDNHDRLWDHVIAEEEGSYFTNRVIWGIGRNTLDRYRFPTSGSDTSFTVEYITKALGSYKDFMHLSLSSTKYITVLDNRILKLSATADTNTSDSKPAIFDRFFAGGIGTLRGFKRRYAGPVERHKDPFGGNSALVGTIELIQPVGDFMYVSVFSDMGNVWYDSLFEDTHGFCASVGVGLQFKALPIHFNYGIPVITGYRHLKHASGRFSFSIGLSY